MRLCKLVTKYPDLFPGKLAVRLSKLQDCYFVPWYFDEEKQLWVGEQRQKGKETKYTSKVEATAYRFYKKVNLLLPKSPIRKRLEREFHFNKYKQELLNK